MGVRLDFQHDAVMKALCGRVSDAIEVEVARVADEARRLCPVGTDIRSLPVTKRLTNTGAVRKKTGVQFIKDERGRVMTKPYRKSESWRAKNPGTLRDSIYTKVRWKNGICLGFVKAGYDRKRNEGDKNAFYAPFVEYGTKFMAAKPFMRPAGAKIRAENIAAAMKAAI